MSDTISSFVEGRRDRSFTPSQLLQQRFPRLNLLLQRLGAIRCDRALKLVPLMPEEVRELEDLS